MMPRRNLVAGEKVRLTSDVFGLRVELIWEFEGKNVACDLDLSCAMLDAQGRLLEFIDFNNVKSCDHALAHGGDEVAVESTTQSEHLNLDLRRVSSRVYAIAMTASLFSRQFADVDLSKLAVEVKQLVYLESLSAAAVTQKVIVCPEPLYKMSLPLDDLEPEANLVVLCAFSTQYNQNVLNGDCSEALPPKWDLECVMRQSRQLTKCDLVHNLQQALNGLYPWLEDEKQRQFSSVSQVCVALSSHALPDLKPKFFKPRPGSDDTYTQNKDYTHSITSTDSLGLDMRSFVEILFGQLARSYPTLRDHQEAATLVALLQELFRQIDINGDERVDWEEFTSHTISTGMQATRTVDQRLAATADEFDVTYHMDTNYLSMTEDDELSVQPIEVMCYVPELQRILVVERKTNRFDAYSRRGIFEHSHTFGTLGGALSGCREMVDAVKSGEKESTQKEESPHVNISGSNANLANAAAAVARVPLSSMHNSSSSESSIPKIIYDLVYIPEHHMLAAALSDHSIHLLKEQLSSAGRHRNYQNVTVLVTHSLHKKLVWAPSADRLLSVDTYSRMYCWSVESAIQSQRALAAPFKPHADILMDMVFIKERGLLATCGLDKKIHLWGVENMRLRGTLTGHTLGVTAMACAQSILVSGGFDTDLRVWNVGARECVTKIQGHRAAITKIAIHAPRVDTACVVSLDVSGECRIWRLETGGNIAGCVEVFQLPFTNASGPTKTLVLPQNEECLIDDFYSDIFFGSSKLYRMIPVKKNREFAPPGAVLFNTLNLHFVAFVHDDVHIWDSRTGTYVQRIRIDASSFDPSLISVSQTENSGDAANNNEDKQNKKIPQAPTSPIQCKPSQHEKTGANTKHQQSSEPFYCGEVSCACFDEPRQRRIILGTESGNILVVSYVTGVVISCVAAHQDEVGGLEYCTHTKCVISYGADRCIHVLRDIKSELQILRTVRNANVAALTCLSYSSQLSVIATGGAGGRVILWDFQTLQQHAMSRLDSVVTAIKLIDPCPLLLVATSTGSIYVWYVKIREKCFISVEAACVLVFPDVLPGARHSLKASDGHDHKSAVTALAVLFSVRRETRSTFDERPSVENSVTDNDWSKQSRRITLYASTDSGHIALWRLGDLPGCVAISCGEFPPPPIPEKFMPRSSQHYKPYRKIFRDMARCDRTAQIGGTADFLHKSIFESSVVCYAHDDSVLRLVVVEDPPCVYSTSADGYQRLWLPQSLQPYGEILLPNIPKTLMAKRTVPICEYTYLQASQLGVGPEHEKLAKLLVAANFTRSSDHIKTTFKTAVKKIMAVNLFGGGFRINPSSFGLDETSEAAVRLEFERRMTHRSVASKLQVQGREHKRNSLSSDAHLLTATSEQTRLRRRSSTIVPERGALLRQRIDRQRILAQMAGGVNPLTNSNETNSESEIVIEKVTTLPTSPIHRSRYDEIASPILQKKQLNATDMTYSNSVDAKSKKGETPLAFSHISISRGLRTGMYDREAGQHLKDIARYGERRRAYERRAEVIQGGCLPGLALDLPIQAESADLHKGTNGNGIQSISVERRDGEWRPVLSGPLADTVKVFAPIRDNSIQRTVEKMESAMATQDTRRANAGRKTINSTGVASSVLEPMPKECYEDMTLDELARPYYTEKDILEFHNSFNYVDFDLSGSINIEEWNVFMTRMNQRVSETEAQLLFLHIDRDGDGSVTMRELIAIVFQRCRPDQQSKIYHKLKHLNQTEATNKRRGNKARKERRESMLTTAPSNDSVCAEGSVDDAASATPSATISRRGSRRASVRCSRRGSSTWGDEVSRASFLAM